MTDKTTVVSGGKVVAWRVANSPAGPFALRKTEPSGWRCTEPLVLQSDLAAAIARAEAAEALLREVQPFIGWTGSYPELHAKIDAIAAQQAEGEDRG